ncbi:MAG: hypothetical protein EBQ92_01145 [Proteobacteria bacterium]|nr:hypothetical protein [Pseudomonadota bacterium]
MAYRLAERLEKTDKRPRRLMITSDQMDITITPIDGNEATPRILLTKWLNSKKRGWFGYKKGFNLEVIDLPSNLSLKIWLDSIDELERYPEPNWWTIGSQKDT